MLKVLAVAFALVVAGAGVSAETHHVVGGDAGWGPDFNVTAWLLGRRFTVGDKIRFEYSPADESIVEVGDAEAFVTCNVSNPIRMLTDPVSHVALEEEGVRYFTSGNAESCRKGLKLPVSVADYKPSSPPYKPDAPDHPPYKPDAPSPPYKPDVPSPPSYKAPPPPSYKAPPPPHEPYPSAAGRLDALRFVLAAAVFIYCLII